MKKKTRRRMRKAMSAFLAATLAFGSFSAITPVQQVTAKYVAETASYARQAATEGIVMLENKENTLPLNVGSEVAIFGRCQWNTFFCGYGSGSAPGAPYTQLNILQGIKNNPSIRYNKELAETYETWCKENVPSNGSWGNWPFYYKEMPLTNEQAEKAAETSDIAIVVIGRAAGEDRECKLEKGSYYLTDDEKSMLQKVNDNFDKIVVLLNVGNLVDMEWVADYPNIKSLLYVWQGGLEMGNAVADVLSGDVTPSGKLADTIAKTYADYPAAATFASNDGNTGTEIYTEDIYVGYRYFETFAKDRVMYPFGYGLSYTTFETTASTEVKNGEVTVTATVTNTGDTYSGKEVVQVYYAAPQGELGKPARALAGYAKTNELAPGASQTLKITFDVDNMASYDDSGVTEHDSSWVLEAGDYDFYVGNSVRAAEKVGSWTLDALKVVEELEEASAPHQEFNRLVPEEQEDGTYAKGSEAVPTVTNDLAERVLKNLPEAVEQTEDLGIKLVDVYNGTKTLDEFVAQLTVEELAAISRGDWGQGSSLVQSGNASAFAGVIASLREKGIPALSTHDGPAGPKVGTSGTALPIGTMLACTWNDELIEKLGYNSGLEMVGSNADVWLAPGMNIHRDPLGGRNFEYFSEDPLLTGQMGASITRGVQNAGGSTMPKHYAVNSQETNRRHSNSVVSERAQREIYLRGFEICVKTAKPYTIMASYNKINGEWSHYNYDTATTILRNDWGFEYSLHTDWWLQRDTSEELGGVADNAYRIRAQVDVNEPGEGPNTENGSSARTDTATVAQYQTWVDAGSPTDRLVGLTLGELQRSAKNVLNTTLHSRAFRAANGLENDYQEGADWFTTEGNVEENKPLLTDLTIEGLDFATFDPVTKLYEVFWTDTENYPEVSAAAEDAQITIKQATAEVPAATITVNSEGGKSIYRVIFSNKAGLEPVVKNPVLAKVTDIKVDGKSLSSFYPTIYSYRVEGSVEDSEITVESASGITYTVTRNAAKNEAVIRAESKDQAVEYTLKFPTKNPQYPVSDDFDDGTLNADIWKVTGQTANLSESDGTLNIQTEQGEWYQNNGIMKNLVNQVAEGNWTATVKLSFPGTASFKGTNTQQFGIAVYDNPDNYIDMNYCTASWSPDGEFLQVRQEIDAVCNDQVSNTTGYADNKSIPTKESWSTKETVNLWMRVISADGKYTFQIQTEDMKKTGEEFVTLGTASANYSSPKIGLYASRGNGNAVTSLVKFDDFQVVAADGAPHSDSFDGSVLNSIWTVDRKNDKMTVSDGSLNIQTESGEWYGSNEDTYPIRNMPYQVAKGNWTATAEFVIPDTSVLKGKNTNQFGMTIFDDSDNYIDINYCTASWATGNDGHFLQVRQEIDGTCKDTVATATIGEARSNIPVEEGWSDKENVTFRLRIKKEGINYKLYVQTDTMKDAGEDYKLLGEASAYYTEPKIGLFATLGKSAETSLVKITNFEITDYENIAEPEKPVKDPVEIKSEGETRVMAVEDARLLTSALQSEACSDPNTPNGKDLGYGDNGAYAVYAITVPQAGYYSMSTRVASGLTNDLAQLHHQIEVDGEEVADFVHKITGGWQTWISTDAVNIFLPAGSHKIRFVYGAQINFNYISFTACDEAQTQAQKTADVKAVIEDFSAKQLQLNQAKANDAETLKAVLAEKINAAIAREESLAFYGVQVQAADIEILADKFQSAQAGTAENPAGTNGSYSFRVTVAENTVTEVRNGVILAEAYVGESSEADKTQLQKVINNVNDMNASDYTAESWAALQAAVKEGNTLLKDTSASQDAVDAATQKILQAILDLEAGVNKVALETAIEAAKKILADPSDYQDVSALQSAVDAGELVLKDSAAKQDAINQAATAITDSMNQLLEKADIASLKKAILIVEEILTENEGRYTEASADALRSAIDHAKEVLNKAGKTEEEVRVEYGKVLDAMMNLQMRGNKAALDAMIKKAEAILEKTEQYVEAGITALQEELPKAKEVYNNADAMQDAVDNAAKELTLKIAAVRLLGDVDNDGIVTTSDTVSVLRAAAELDTLSEDDAASADVNKDGKVDTKDAVQILRKAAEL